MALPSFLGPAVKVPDNRVGLLDKSLEAARSATPIEVPIVVQSQLLSNWCWAAVTASVREYFAEPNSKAQCEVATEFLVIQCCPPGPDIFNNPRNREYNIKTALGANSPGQPIKRPLVAGEITASVKAGRPVCCVIRWENGRLHFVLLTGFVAGSGSVIVRDPLLGKFVGPLATFVSAYEEKGRWVASLPTSRSA